MILRHCERLIAQRTAAINALPWHAAEFGVIPAKGPGASRGGARSARASNTRPRTLLVVGGMAVIRRARSGRKMAQVPLLPTKHEAAYTTLFHFDGQ
jgi:hypothetical protein